MSAIPGRCIYMANDFIQQITYIDLIWSFGLVLLLGIISVVEGLRFERSLGIGVLRTVIQLSLVGYFLKWIFHLRLMWVILIIMAVMTVVAVRTAQGRLKKKYSEFQWLLAVSLVIGCVITTYVVTHLVVGVKPWWRPEYLLPLFGMILGNGMTGVALAGERLQSELEHRKLEIETLLALGYSSHDASANIRRDAMRAGLMPTINSMMIVGVVQLPGIMSGQILSGVDPTLAVKYQIMVMFMIAGSSGIASWIFTRLLLGRYFTSAHQLRYWMI